MQTGPKFPRASNRLKTAVAAESCFVSFPFCFAFYSAVTPCLHNQRNLLRSSIEPAERESGASAVVFLSGFLQELIRCIGERSPLDCTPREWNLIVAPMHKCIVIVVEQFFLFFFFYRVARLSTAEGNWSTIHANPPPWFPLLSYSPNLAVPPFCTDTFCGFLLLIIRTRPRPQPEHGRSFDFLLPDSK